MARTIRTSHTKNHTIPGMAYPLMVLVLATTASYPQMPDLIDTLAWGGPVHRVANRPSRDRRVQAAFSVAKRSTGAEPGNGGRARWILAHRTTETTSQWRRGLRRVISGGKE
jgi:hypothetical protein